MPAEELLGGHGEGLKRDRISEVRVVTAANQPVNPAFNVFNLLAHDARMAALLIGDEVPERPTRFLKKLDKA